MEFGVYLTFLHFLFGWLISETTSEIYFILWSYRTYYYRSYSMPVQCLKLLQSENGNAPFDGWVFCFERF